MKTSKLLIICNLIILCFLNDAYCQGKMIWKSKVPRPSKTKGVDFNNNGDIYVYTTSLVKSDISSIYDYAVTRIDKKGNSSLILDLKDTSLDYKFEKGINGFITKERKSNKVIGEKNLIVGTTNKKMNSNFYSIEYKFYSPNGKIIDTIELIEKNQSIYQSDIHIIDGYYYIVAAMGHNLVPGSKIPSKIFMIKLDGNAKEIWRKDIDAPYYYVYQTDISSVADISNKKIFLETSMYKKGKRFINTIDINGEVINSTEIENFDTLITSKWGPKNPKFSLGLNKAFKVETVKVKPKEKKASKKQSIIYSYDVETKKVNEKKVSNDIFAYAQPLKVLTLDKAMFLFYKLKKKKADDRLFLTKYDKDLNELATIELTDIASYNFKNKSYLSQGEGSRIILQNKNNITVFNSNLEVLTKYEYENKIHAFKLHKKQLFLLVKKKGAMLFDIEW